jgi:localization factor PodJL
MKPGLPWSVKGIEPDVREAAKLAARRSGMTLGEWLNSTIMDQADGAADAPPPPPAVRARTAAAGMPAIERAASRLEDIAEKLARLSIGESATASRIGIHAAGERDDSEIIQRVLSRVDNNERQTVEAITAVNERIAGLSRQLTAAPRPAASRVEDSQSFQALEKAVRSIVEHMETSEKRNKETFKSLQDRIAGLNSKAQTSDNDQIVRQAPAFSALESRLADLAKRVERSENAPQHQTLSDLLRREITDLAKRIDQVRENSEALASKAQTQAVQASQQELRAIEGRILGLLKEAQMSLSSASAGPAEIQRLRGEIERLNRRIDETAQPSAGPEVLELRAAVEQLSTRVAQGPDMRPFADMDRRILDITQRLEQTQAATRSMPQFAELENRIAELDYKFSEAMAGRGSSHAAEIEDRIAEVAERLSRTEQQLSSLETIERAVNQLFDTMEQQRKWTEEVAEGAASRMAQQIMAAGPQQVSLAGSPEIQALENGLTAVRTAAESADQRNQETLEAVHDTLEQIVTKLAELETAAIGQRVAAAAAPTAPLMDQQAEPLAAHVHETYMPQAEQQAGNPFADVIAAAAAGGQPMAPIHPAPAGFADAPTLNPFEVAPQPAANPFAPIGAAPVEANAFAGGDDFIAAARRAAQAASQQKSILAGISPGAAKMSEESSKKLLNLSFFKRKSASQAQGPVGLAGEIKPPPGFKAANSNTENKRRKLLLMGLVLLAAVSAFTFNMMGRSHKAKAPAAPAAVEQPMQQDQSAVPAPATVSPVPAEGGSAPAAPATPAPAPLESGALEDGEPDPILTGSLPQTLGAKPISALVSGEAAAPESLPPAEVGSMSLREAAALGDATAQFVIATRYLNGEKVAQDYEKAAYWYGKAAVQGSAPAQYRLATMYERGRGVAKDLKAALGWYERSASLGNVKSMHNAAVLASGNELGEPDYARAYKWFSLGAAHGLKDSQFNLAVLLERGLGTEANKADAWFWYSVAGQQKDDDAKKRAAALAKAMTPAEALAAKTRLAAWSPEKAPDAANVIAINNADWNVQMSVGG